MATHVDWNGAEWMKQFEQAQEKNVRAAAVFFAGEVKKDLSVSGTGVAKRSLKRGDKTYPKGRRIYGANPSKPGEPPHKQHGHLRRAIAWEVVRRLIGRVGMGLKYGRRLELKMDRSFLRAGLEKHRAGIVALLTRRHPK